MVVRTLAFMILRQVLSLVGLDPSPDAKDIEILTLRHQLAILQRQIGKTSPYPARPGVPRRPLLHGLPLA
jgi:hypothetical protein